MPSMNEIKATAWLWRMAILKMVLLSIAALWTCWATATSGLDMTKLGAWDWCQTIGGCLASWTLTIVAFIDKSAAQLSSGHIPGLDDTVIPTDSKPTTPADPAQPKVNP